MAIVYGRLTPYELDKQGGDPYINTGGRRYRITDLVARHDGGANYQAREVTEHDPEPAQPALPDPVPAAGVEDGVRVVHVTPPVTVVEWSPPEFKPIAPPLSKWAREHGWTGTGRIPKVIRLAYASEFGLEE